MVQELKPIIRTEHLKKYFKLSRDSYLHAVDDINLKIYPGKTLGVVGESGCGKSTLGRCILRLIEPTSGRVFFNEEDITNYSHLKMKEMRKHMQIIFQDPYSSLNPRLTVEEQIAEYLIVNRMCKTRKERNRKIDELMDMVGLDRRLAGYYPHELDGGRRQRIGIARALSLSPKFIVCDEPVSALDVSIQAQILNLLMDLQEELGLAYMFITHDLSVVKHISDEIMVMYLGQCVEFAESDRLFEHPAHPYTRSLLAALLVPSLETHYKKVELIKGEISNPINPKPGCRFAPRCPYVKDKCFEETPQFREIAEGHYVACWKEDL